MKRPCATSCSGSPTCWRFARRFSKWTPTPSGCSKRARSQWTRECASGLCPLARPPGASLIKSSLIKSSLIKSSLIKSPLSKGAGQGRAGSRPCRPGSAHVTDFERLYFVEHARLFRASQGIFIDAHVFLGHLVYVLVGPLFRDVYDPPSHFEVAVRVVGVEYRQGD